MTITHGYCTLDEFKLRFYAGSSSTTDDEVAETAIETASRFIDDDTGRHFWKSASAEARYFTSEYPDLFVCADDIVSITSLLTDSDGDRTYETTWQTTDYDLEPYNAAVVEKPYTQLRITPNGTYSFPTLRRGVKLTAVFGWPAVPKLAKSACIMQAGRWFKRKDAIFGVLGSADMGQIMLPAKLDPDVSLMLNPLRRFDNGKR